MNYLFAINSRMSQVLYSKILFSAFFFLSMTALWSQDANPVDIIITPVNNPVSANDQFQVDIVFNAGSQGIDAGEFHLDFDPAFLEVVSTVDVGPLSATLLPTVFDNTAGTIDYSKGILTGPATGTFTALEIQFRALAPTAGTLIDFASLVFPRETQATLGGNDVLDELINASIVINGGMPGTVTVAGTVCDETWTANNTYLLDGYVSVPSGCNLTIQPGTVVKGLASPTDPTNTGSTLIICQGGTIDAQGTPDAPIIFTAESDDITDPFDLGQFTTGLWGGVILLGNAPLNSPAGSTPITDLIEGINPASGTCRTFGGSSATDNSGTLRYISIRHGGTELQPNDEINGLTLGGIGNLTTIENVEVYANDDDGIEWFGGTVNVKNASVAFVSDDSYDYDQGWNGRGQFWFSIGDNAAGSNRSGEHDGATSPESAQPFTTPNISNATYIGKGSAPQGEPEIILFRDNAGGRYANSIFCESNTGIRVELNFNEPLNSNTQLQANNLQVLNGAFGGGTLFIPSIAFNITPNNQDPTNTAQTNQLALARNVAAGSFTAFNNDLGQACPIGAINRTDNSGALDPRTTSAKAASFTGFFTDSFFQQVAYIGAFAPGSTAGTGANPGTFWADWTYLAERNILISALQR